MTQRELARKAGIALRTVCGIETGRHEARMTSRRKLLRALGVPFERAREVFPEEPRRRRPRPRL